MSSAPQTVLITGASTGFGRDTAIEGREALLQDGHSRVRQARIDVAADLHVEERRGLLGILEDVRGRLVDRHRAAAKTGVGRLACMEAQGVKFVVGHGDLPLSARKAGQDYLDAELPYGQEALAH